jgi:hypothetical protein
MARALTSKLLAPADPLAVTTLTDSVTLPAVVFVAVALSITALQLVAVYCVVCVFSACLAATNTLDVTVILVLYQAGIYLVVPLSFIGIHFVGLPAVGPLVIVAAAAPDPFVSVTDESISRPVLFLSLIHI